MVNFGLTIMTKTFGEILSEKLADLKIKPAKLAQMSGITKQNIGRLLHGTRHPITNAPPKTTEETVEKIARALDWDIDDALLAAGFAPRKKKMETVDDEFAALFYESADWSEENRNEALEMAKIIFKRFKEKERAQKETQK